MQQEGRKDLERNRKEMFMGWKKELWNFYTLTCKNWNQFQKKRK
jgi:hypothetical protein